MMRPPGNAPWKTGCGGVPPKMRRAGRGLGSAPPPGNQSFILPSASRRDSHMKVFRVSGKFRMGHITTPFTIETIGADEKGAQDRVLATLGSRHRVNRHQVAITKTQEIKVDQIEDPAVEKQLSMVK